MDAPVRSVARGSALDGNEARFCAFPPLFTRRTDSSEKRKTAAHCRGVRLRAQPTVLVRPLTSCTHLIYGHLWDLPRERGRTTAVFERVPFHAALHKTFEFAGEGTMKIKERLPRLAAELGARVSE